MSSDGDFQPGQPIADTRALEALFREGEKSPQDWRLGLEHEKLLFDTHSGRSVAYHGPRGIGEIFTRLLAFGYEGIREEAGGHIVALKRGSTTISLEPGGQLEFSSSPAHTARQIHLEHLAHLDELREVLRALELVAVTLAYRPFEAPEQIPLVPRARFSVMRNSLARTGLPGFDMMVATASVQVSLDWEDETDCARKIGVLARMTPLLIALCANSPIARGRAIQGLSYRGHVLRGMDPARSGYLPSMLDGSFSYSRYVDWALKAPVLFLRRGDHFVDPKACFGDLVKRGWDGQPVTFLDWENHVSTLFPEVRIKRVLEVRSPDCVDPSLTGALLALLRGLLYDPTALADLNALLPRNTLYQQLEMHECALNQGLSGRFQGRSLLTLVRGALSIAKAGLGRIGAEDLPLLEPIEERIVRGESPSHDVIRTFSEKSEPVDFLKRYAI